MNGPSRHLQTTILLGGLLFVLLTSGGCSRRFWREQADHDSYELIAEKMNDPAWSVPRMDITPDPRSRFYDPFDPDHTPLPPDDEAANELLHEVGGWKGYKSWHEFGRAFSVENPHWLENLIAGREEEEEETILQTSAVGTVERQAGLADLNLGELIELSYIHNREYQREVEDVYLEALDVSQERFVFDVRYLRTPGASGSTPRLDIDGESIPDGRNSINFASGLGISQVLPSGAQWALELTNNTLWIFSGGASTSASAISYSLVQPLMRNAGRKIGLENLTLSERQLLYSVRDLARFRKVFFGNVTGSNGYLGLLLQVQLLENERSNIRRLERQLEQLTVLASRGVPEGQTAKSLDIASLASQLVRSQNSVRQSEIRLQDSYDAFKISLGLPPDLKFSIDTELLKRFELIDPALIEMEARVYSFKGESWGDLDPPVDEEIGQREVFSKEVYAERSARLRQLYDEVIEVVVGSVERDFENLKDISPDRVRLMSEEEALRYQRDLDNDRQLFDQAKARLQGLLEIDPADDDTGALARIEKLLAADELTLEAKKEIYDLGSGVYDDLVKEVQALQVVQVDQRVEKVILQPFEMSLEEVTQLALENRLDLKNSRAILNDSRRAVEIAANELEAALNLRLEGDYATPRSSNNPVKFNGSASSFRAGVEFDTPLDQLQERNVYRASQIAYQRARRDFMAAEDAVKQDVREAWRQLQILNQNFETARQQVRFAAIEFDAAVEDANDPSRAGGSGLRGQNLLNALESVLRAQNAFIGFWIQYEINRINIYRDMGIMRIDNQGVWEDPYYQSLAYPGQESPKTDPEATDLQPIPDSQSDWKSGVKIPPLPSRFEPKRLSSIKLPPAPAQSFPSQTPPALLPDAAAESTQTQPRKGLLGGQSSPTILRSPTTDNEELRNAQPNQASQPEFDIPVDSPQWKLPIIR